MEKSLQDVVNKPKGRLQIFQKSHPHLRFQAFIIGIEIMEEKDRKMYPYLP